MRRTTPQVIAGESYKHARSDYIVETATVIAVSEWDGIPHVKYRCRINLRDDEGSEELRTMALAAFAARYPERAPTA